MPKNNTFFFLLGVLLLLALLGRGRISNVDQVLNRVVRFKGSVIQESLLVLLMQFPPQAHVRKLLLLL